MSITWQNDAVELLRVMVGDLDECNEIYTESRLIRVLIASAFMINQEADFTQDFIVNISGQSITPDPTDTENETNDENFINLMCMKAACIIDTGSAILAAQNAFSVKDMVFNADLKGVADGTLALLKQGWCKTYEAALKDYIYGDGGTPCAAVMGPFRTVAFRYGRPDNSNYFGYPQRGY